MLGAYNNFPETVHRIENYATSVSNRKLQQALTETLQKLNNETFDLETIADPSIPQCKVSFETGIAEADNFNYLDTEEAGKLLRIIQKEPLQTMDCLFVIRYHKMLKEKKTPLRFDYYILRFTFNENSMNTQIFHERGPRYMTLQDIMNLIAAKLNEKSTKNMLKALNSP